MPREYGAVPLCTYLFPFSGDEFRIVALACIPTPKGGACAKVRRSLSGIVESMRRNEYQKAVHRGRVPVFNRKTGWLCRKDVEGYHSVSVTVNAIHGAAGKMKSWPTRCISSSMVPAPGTDIQKRDPVLPAVAVCRFMIRNPPSRENRSQ